MCHLNIQSLSNKVHALELMLSNESIDIVCLTEHWLQSCYLQIEGYAVVSSCLREKMKNGGSIILIKNGLVNLFKEFDVRCDVVEGHSELCVAIFGDYSIICCYRSPSGDVNVFLTSVSNVLTKISNRSKYIIFCGDLNIDYLSDSADKKRLCDVFDSFELKITTVDPTRIFTYRDGHTSSTCIDYVATNLPKKFFQCVLFNPHLSDHLAHAFSFLYSNSETNNDDSLDIPYPKILRNLSDCNISMFKNMIMIQDWNVLLNNNNNGVDMVWADFINTIIHCLNYCCPYKKQFVRKKRSDHWYNNELANTKKILDQLFWLQNNTSDFRIREEYRSLQKSYKSQIRETKKQFYASKISQSCNKTKTIWNIVNVQLNRNKNNEQDICLRSDHEIISIPHKIAEEFSIYFSNAPAKKIQQKYGCSSTECTVSACLSETMLIAEVKENEIITIINNLSNKKSSGFDDINVKILRGIGDIICQPLTNLINLSLKYSTFPRILKTANVVPIYKKNERDKVENYRQISLLSLFSKVIEKIVYDRIISFVVKFKVLHKCQHGFFPGKSIETATFDFLKYVYECVDSGKYVVSLFFDLSIAFDTVNKPFLLSKLYNLGIRGIMLDWINSYMTNRNMVVKYKGDFSSTQPVNMGVPQGSVLGPLLFILYTNDLSENLNADHITMYADDTTIVVSAYNLDELSDKINMVRNEMNVWCKKNDLILNSEKTVLMNIYNRKPIPSVFGQYSNINFCEQTKFLGTSIDSRLTFVHHIGHVSAKLNSAFFAILKLKYTLDENSLLSVYYSLAYSFMSNNVISWGVSGECCRIFVGQKRIVRLIFNLKLRESCKDIFVSKQILTFPSLYMYKCVQFVNRNRFRFASLGASNRFSTRGNYLLEIPFHKTSFFENSPHYKCIKFYNALPGDIRSLRGITFDKQTKRYFLTKAFYSTNEFLTNS